MKYTCMVVESALGRRRMFVRACRRLARLFVCASGRLPGTSAANPQLHHPRRHTPCQPGTCHEIAPQVRVIPLSVLQLNGRSPPLTFDCVQD